MTVFTPPLVFGGTWGTPSCEGAEEVGTPVGVPCLLCEDVIELGDRGFIQAAVVIGANGDGPQVSTEPIHRECQLRSVLGSLGHILKVCACNGGPMEDPPSLTRHQGAKAVWDYYEALGVMGTTGEGRATSDDYHPTD